MKPIEVRSGHSPLVLAMPHSGTFVPSEIMKRLNERGQALADTDWHIPRLYDGLAGDASIIKANFHRYVIDANRSPEDESLYPGQNTTGLCPLIDFEGYAIYNSGMEPTSEEIQIRLETYHRPYHAAIEVALLRGVENFGFAILYDCHSIRSEVEFLFDGKLPDLNIGTFSGKSCDFRIEKQVAEICTNASQYSSVVNGRFKGGWTTRHYGRPGMNMHAVQMEIAQSCYMEESAPWKYREDLAGKLRIVLRDVLTEISTFAPNITE